MKKFGKRLSIMLLLGMLTFAAACGTDRKDKNEADMAGSSAAESLPQRETGGENTAADTEAFDGDETNDRNNSVTDPNGTDSNVTDPNGMDSNGTDSVADDVMDAGKDVIDGAGNIVEDAVDGAADAAKDLTDGAANAGKDAANAVSDAAGR